MRVIHAHSPQAKGRIERIFKTFQDRVIKEMRLKGIKTKEEANEFLSHYLPIYNMKFREISLRPVRDKITEPKLIKSGPKKAYIPPEDHPWKKYPAVNRNRNKEMRELLLTET